MARKKRKEPKESKTKIPLSTLPPITLLRRRGLFRRKNKKCPKCEMTYPESKRRCSISSCHYDFPESMSINQNRGRIQSSDKSHPITLQQFSDFPERHLTQHRQIYRLGHIHIVSNEDDAMVYIGSRNRRKPEANIAEQPSKTDHVKEEQIWHDHHDVFVNIDLWHKVNKQMRALNAHNRLNDDQAESTMKTAETMTAQHRWEFCTPSVSNIPPLACQPETLTTTTQTREEDNLSPYQVSLPSSSTEEMSRDAVRNDDSLPSLRGESALKSPLSCHESQSIKLIAQQPSPPIGCSPRPRNLKSPLPSALVVDLTPITMENISPPNMAPSSQKNESTPNNVLKTVDNLYRLVDRKAARLERLRKFNKRANAKLTTHLKSSTVLLRGTVRGTVSSAQRTLFFNRINQIDRMLASAINEMLTLQTTIQVAQFQNTVDTISRLFEVVRDSINPDTSSRDRARFYVRSKTLKILSNFCPVQYEVVKIIEQSMNLDKYQNQFTSDDL